MRPERSTIFSSPPGFSLVEVAVAIGLFAFAVVGIMGLFPAAVAQRVEASRETRARLIAQQIFEGLQGSAAPLIEDAEILLPPFLEMGEQEGDDAPKEGELRRRGREDFPFCLGYGEGGTTPLRDIAGREAWDNGTLSNAELKDTTFIALITREPTDKADLYSVEVQVGFPANLPAERRRNLAFASLVYMP